MENNLTSKQEFSLELIGTAVLVLLGDGVCAMTTLFKKTGDTVVMGGYTNVTLGWGFAVLMGILIAFRAGAHLNPAVSIGLASIGKFSWKKVPHYVAAQMLGGFIGALLVFVIYYSKWIEFDPQLAHTAGILSTFPAVDNFWSGLVDQVIGTAVLLFMILVIGDRITNPILAPIFVAFLIMAIGISLGGMHGYAINPARDFSPRLFSAIVGMKNNGLTDGTGIWIVPVIGPIIGGVIGCFLHKLTVATTE